MTEHDTIYALSSGRPPAAIAVIRLSGPDAFKIASAVVGTLPEPGRAALRTIKHPLSGESLDEGLVLRFSAPASASGEDTVEFHCHGGRAVIDGVLGALGTFAGAREAHPGEFTRRAFSNGRIDLTQAEGLADLIESETEAQRKSAILLAEGRLRRQIEFWRTQLLEMSASAELAIDYDEEDTALDPMLSQACRILAEELGSWLAQPRIELLKDGLKVVVAGPPNSGKSSLVNALAGVDKAIVTDVAGTTRDVIEVPLSVGGLPVMLTDTAGLRTSADPVEAIGIDRARRFIDLADLLIWLGEPEDCPPHRSVIRIHSKADLPDRAEVPEGLLGVSVVSGKGLNELLAGISERARSLLPAEGMVALNRRQAEQFAVAQGALEEAARADDLLIAAEELRRARLAFERLTGRAGIEDLLDSLFSRFCLGK